MESISDIPAWKGVMGGPQNIGHLEEGPLNHCGNMDGFLEEVTCWARGELRVPSKGRKVWNALSPISRSPQPSAGSQQTTQGCRLGQSMTWDFWGVLGQRVTWDFGVS